MCLRESEYRLPHIPTYLPTYIHTPSERPLTWTMLRISNKRNIYMTYTPYATTPFGVKETKFPSRVIEALQILAFELETSTEKSEDIKKACV